MLHIPISRWGEPYKSLETDKVVHFDSGEALAEVSRANGGLVERDMRHAARAYAETASWDAVFDGVYAAYESILPQPAPMPVQLSA